ncbi:MAG: NAD(P)/FAD-dependent oxidoreductase [Candidatus Omnitrophota bacterium]
MEKINITIIGAGVVGLAVAYELSKHYHDIFVLERNSSFGQETSSRNSEVIHAGIYYPANSFKAKTCIEGRELVYEFCKAHNINHKKTGKLIVAIDKSEVKELENLYNNGRENGVMDLTLISRSDIKKIEQYIKAEAAIYAPSTGILDTHSFMKNLEFQFQSHGGMTAYNTELVGIDKADNGYKVYVRDKNGEKFDFFTRVLINSAGLSSDRIARMAGIQDKEYELKYCKGDYFRVGNNKAKFINRLIYPVPIKTRAGLGIHATLDLGGSLRLGPDDEYVTKIDYNIDERKAQSFYESVRTFLPFIEADDLGPDMAGIRPKLQGEGEDFRDFLICEEKDKDLPGFINLVGIESPGLTACLSIAKLVKKMVH